MIKIQPKMTPDLSPYREIIHSLAPLVNHAEFNKAFKRRTQNIASDLSFLIKMEVKRLAKPCIRSIDLRTKVNDECRLFNYQGIPHYLHVNGIFEFEKLVKRYGEYTFGVYEGVINFSEEEKRRMDLVKTQSVVVQDTELQIPDDKFVTPCQELLNFPIRKEERLNYVVAIEVFFTDNTSAHASTLDISVHGLKIRFKDPEALEKISVAAPIHVVFRGLDRSTGIARDSIEYQILGVSGRNAKTCVHLLRPNTSPNEQFTDFVLELIKLQKRRYKVNLDNVEMALSSKVYEQSFANTIPGLPVFIEKTEEGKLHAAYASTNSCSKRILDYWLDENHHQMLGYLLNENRLRQLTSDSAAYPQTTVYCFHHIADDKIYFYSASTEELLEQPKLAETFLSYGARRVSWRVYHLAYSDVNPSDAYVPSSVPDGINRDIDKLNKRLSPRLQGRLKSLTGMLTVTDITNSNAQEVYQRRKLDKSNIRLLKYFGHARNKPPKPVETYRHKQKELRRQTRYILRTPVIVKTNNGAIHGFTEDFSVSGLRLELDQEFHQRMNSKVQISFPKLQEITQNFELKNVQYRVKHINTDKQVLHLQAVSDDETGVAEQFFSQLISNNTDKLQALEQEERLPGMGIALRNLHGKSSPQACIYVEKQQNGFMPAMATINQMRASWLKFLHHNANLVSFNLSWLYQDDMQSTAFIRQSIKMMSLDPKPITSEIYVSFDPKQKRKDNQVYAKWQYQLSTHRAKRAFVKAATESGQFFAFSVTFNKALRPDMERLEQELLYLSQHAIHKATYFEERMWDIAATIFLTDITQEVLYRYRLPQQDAVD
ncbi:PilZ domain-containing protein [Agaribacter marinus]|uniref:PilZ domain-containing protein n=1 Tax=Agaribacter marinus TaxID=1431249 RepID=UPI0024E16751|nr:PilZ domain-containing protein [Agaribacter marinus]